MKNLNSIAQLASVFIFTIALIGCQSAPRTIQTGPEAELSFDGLHKVDNSGADMAWARPDFDLSGYTKMMLVGTGIEYTMVKNERITRLERDRGGPFFINDEARAQFEELVESTFKDELQKVKRFTIVDEPGPDVLIVRGGLLDVTSYVPPERVGGRAFVFLNTVGAATLVLELRDSQTGSILARSIDRRAAETLGGQFRIANSVTNSSEVRRLIRFWAVALRENLDGFIK